MNRPKRLHLRTQKRHERGTMNRTERRFAEEHLIPGTIVLDEGFIHVHSWKFESVNLTLAPNTQYRPDFYVVASDGQSIYIEVKARTKAGRVLWEDDARVKFKVAANEFPESRFICASYSTTGGWKFEEITQ